MEKKQLNFSAPLMSARRYSSPLRSSCKDNQRDFPKNDPETVQPRHPDHNLDEVVKPGSVPFVWEQIPGKAKGGDESLVMSHQGLPSTPKLPPGRNSDHLNGLRTPSRLSGELAMLKFRNKLSGELTGLRPQNKFLRFSGEIHTLNPFNKFSGEIKTISKISSWNDVMVSSKEGTEMNASSESDNDDSTFSDALEALSQLESFSFNCSVSGLSDSQRPEMNPSVTVSNDEKARDFMMDRFLPAAKAMTLEPSHYASRKQLMVVEQPKEVKALVPRANTPPPGGNVCHIVPYTGQDIGSEESEEEEDNCYDGQSAISAVKIKSCGFLPWFCSKNALRILNPLPTMKHKSKISASKISRLVKSGSLKSPAQKLAKHVPCSTHKQKVHTSFKSCELQKPTYTSRPMFYSGELQTRSGSPYRSSRRSNASPYRVESPHSFYQKGVGYLSVPKREDQSDNVNNLSKLTQRDSKRYEELRRSSRLLGINSPVAEKALYIDPVNITKVSHSILNLPKTKKQVDMSTKEHGISFENGGRTEIMKARGLSGRLDYNGVNANVSSPDVSSGRKTKLLEFSRMASNGNVNTCRELVLVNDNPDDTMQALFTPPLPKSPSESWLSRNLPSASPRNSVSYLSLNSKLQSINLNAKWETIVKSSHMHHDHGRYSEELVTHVPQLPRAWK